MILSLLLINPTSGAGRGARIGRTLLQSSHPSRVHFSQSFADSQIAIDKAKDEGIDTIIACGGDGLIHAAIQGCVRHDLNLLPVPAGTGNDFCRALGFEPSQKYPNIDELTIERIDLGVTEGRYFGAILSSGFDAVVSERANALAWPKGPMRYNVAILRELPFFRAMPFQITLDGQEIEREAMLVAIANAPSYGGGMRVCPDASMIDGQFDVMILSKVSKFEFLRVFPKVYKGAHISHPQVEIFRASSVHITADAIAYADGERMGTLPMLANISPLALKVYRPRLL